MKKVELKKNKYYILILTVFFIFMNLINVTYATDNTITQQDIVNYFEKMKNESGTEIKSIETTENCIKIIGEDEQKQVLNLYYDLTTMEFYCEAEFTNEIDYEMAELKLQEVLLFPYYGFCAVADTLNVDEEIYQQYAVENGLMENTFLIIAVMGNAKVQELPAIGVLDQMDEEVINGINNETNKFYSVKLEKIQEEQNIKLKLTLKMKIEEDFSTMYEEIQDKAVLVTEENADYKITIKVGETYKFDIGEKIIGYNLRGGSNVKISEDNSEFIGETVGTTYGYILVENGQKSVYIKVIEANNEDPNNGQDNQEQEEQGQGQGNNGNIDNTIADKDLPDTGKALLTTIISIIICSVIIGYIKYRNLNIK